MMISHPSEYVAMTDRAAKATGADKERADEIVANMAYGLIPEGPAKRAVVFGGSNAHIFTDDAHGAPVSRDAARALVAALTGPEWSLRLNWAGSNPSNLLGFQTEWMEQKLEEIKFLEPVRDYKARHASTLLTFDAVVDAIGQIEAKTKSDTKQPAAAQG